MNYEQFASALFAFESACRDDEAARTSTTVQRVAATRQLLKRTYGNVVWAGCTCHQPGVNYTTYINTSCPMHGTRYIDHGDHMLLILGAAMDKRIWQ